MNWENNVIRGINIFIIYSSFKNTAFPDPGQKQAFLIKTSLYLLELSSLWEKKAISQ